MHQRPAAGEHRPSSADYYGPTGTSGPAARDDVHSGGIASGQVADACR